MARPEHLHPYDVPARRCAMTPKCQDRDAMEKSHGSPFEYRAKVYQAFVDGFINSEESEMTYQRYLVDWNKGRCS
jgi:hypothetical protein